MLFYIGSDIHGSLPYAKRFIEKALEDKADRIILLGDLYYNGARNDPPEGYAPKEVIKILSSLSDSIISVRGNCEAEVDQMVLPFPVLSETALVFADGRKIFMTHGHGITPDNAPKGIDCFFSGHTHIPVLEEKDGMVFLNPGSISIPKGGFPPSYAVWDGGDISIRNLWDGSMMFSLGKKA